MPNECSNTTLISGPADEIRRFVSAVTRQDGDTTITEIARSLIPMPEGIANVTTAHATAEPHPNWAVMLADGKLTQERYDELVASNAENWKKYQENIAQYGYADWYHWALDNWGTKWGDYDHWGPPSEEEIETGEVSYRYNTAWAPLHEPFWGAVSQKFPTLTFVNLYSEPGMSFCGAAAVRNDQIVARYVNELPEWNDEEDFGDWLEGVETLSYQLGIEALKELNETLASV